uniref:Sentrin-specific protease 7-like n=1 Tax=Labrus bergylta TaxID=56723 RepID=A0A3Q3GWH6_9LABR|nr:sentrin-specific protease 7-like [Labrus bergylta]
MASPFKIPKKKQPAGSDSTPLHMQSPLSRLQSPAPQVKSYADQSGRGGADRMHSGNTAGTQSTPIFKDVVKTLLGLNRPNGTSAANHRAAGSYSSQSQPGQRAEPSSCFSNGWRPKRASHRLQLADSSEAECPPQKKKSDLTGSSSPFSSVSVKSMDCLAELRALEHAGSLSSMKGGRHDSSQDDFLSPCRLKHKDLHRPSISTATPDRRSTQDRTSWHAASSDQQDDLRERERKRWSDFRDRKRMKTPTVLQLRKQTPTEPIVLSSEEEEEGEDEGDGGQRTPQSSSEGAESRLGNSEQKWEADRVSPPRGETDECLAPPPSFLQLQFSSLHAGLTQAHANGKLMITEHCITVPLKGLEEGEVTVVASQVRGYGVWDGGVARDGALLADWKGPAPSLLFLWVTDAQANLLQRELSIIQTSNDTSGPACSCLLLVLTEQLQELQAALLVSILDMEEYRRGGSSGGPSSPLEWTDGLLLLHSCPPPVDQHLLTLLGHSEEKSGPTRDHQRTNRSKMNPCVQQQLSSRLIQYPAAPSRGRISVSKEDLACLGSGEFLNDVIIDFYLKYLLLEGVGGSVAGRSHVFSSFFFKQLSRRRVAGEDDAPSVPDRHTRHQRVKTWTRHVDIFTKDFLFVPVNQEAHWFLVVVCFPGLEEVQYEEFQRPTGGKESLSLRSQHAPDCTEQGRQRDTVLKRPCILVMDSLKLSYRENVCRLLREYLQVEWEVRRGTPRLFTSDSMRNSNCRVSQQDNSSDCGLYLLQYTESFLLNPVVHFDLPLRLDNWFPRQRVRQKREDIRSLILTMHRTQKNTK